VNTHAQHHPMTDRHRPVSPSSRSAADSAVLVTIILGLLAFAAAVIAALPG
jgi:hypothetical protein